MSKPVTVLISMTPDNFNSILAEIKNLAPADRDGVREIVVVRKPDPMTTPSTGIVH